MGFFNSLSRDNTIAKNSFNRWMVVPAALAVHLSIGQIYAYSVFNSPLSRVIGITESSNDDWTLATIGWVFSIALFVLGASAAIFGKWVEKVGPRMSMFVAGICFASGFFISALGVSLHSIWLLYLGNGVIGGIGLGIGYISPVSTLMKWFPDKPGMATGMAIMGFGGGAMIASPLSVKLMQLFSSENSVGVSSTFMVMGCIYLVLMLFGSFIVRVPKDDWKPDGFIPDVSKENLSSTKSVLADNAIKTPQFYLLFFVLMLNVTAGIGVLGQASVMIQEMFSDVTVEEAAGFVGLLSLFNMLGRFIWSSLSDYIGRKNTYYTFFILGIILYSSIPTIGGSGSLTLFIIVLCVIISMYGGGFATIPAYLRDMFGTKQVGAIHGRVLLAWSIAALIGPSLINYIRQYQLEVLQLPKTQVYSITMYIMTGLLCIGLICNALVKPTEEKYFN